GERETEVVAFVDDLDQEEVAQRRFEAGRRDLPALRRETRTGDVAPGLMRLDELRRNQLGSRLERRRIGRQSEILHYAVSSRFRRVGGRRGAPSVSPLTRRATPDQVRGRLSPVNRGG